MKSVRVSAQVLRWKMKIASEGPGWKNKFVNKKFVFFFKILLIKSLIEADGRGWRVGTNVSKLKV